MDRYERHLQHLEATLPHLDPPAVQALLKRGETVLVDVREPDEFAAAHIPGALNLPRFRLEARIETAVPDPAARLILYCGSRGRSTLAAATLRDMGLDAMVLKGGLKAWVGAGLRVEEESGRTGPT
ncbi:MAG: rhodanese-like domain-containing protein [Pseudomonadota bacterium]